MLLLHSTVIARFSLIHLLPFTRAALDTQWISKECYSSENSYLIATVDVANAFSEKWYFFYY